MKEIIDTLCNKNRPAVAIIIAAALICLLMLTPAVTALVTDGAPQTNEAPQAEGSGNSGVVSLDLPSKLPFKIFLPSSGGWGFVSSDDFHITNHSEHPLPVSLNSVYFTTSDAYTFAISDSENLPDVGNNIFISLVCMQNDNLTSYSLSDKEIDTHTFWLESGETVYFFFEGVVNELGDIPWSDANVQVSVKFVFIDLNNGDESDIVEDDEYNIYGPEDTDYIIEEDVFETDADEYAYENLNSYVDWETQYYWDSIYNQEAASDMISDSGDDTDASEYAGLYEDAHSLYMDETTTVWDDYYSLDSYYGWDNYYNNDNTDHYDWDSSSDMDLETASDTYSEYDSSHSSYTDTDYYDQYNDYDQYNPDSEPYADISADPYTGEEPDIREDADNQTEALVSAIDTAIMYLGDAIAGFEFALNHYADQHVYFDDEYAYEQLSLAIVAAKAALADAESTLSAVFAAGYYPDLDASLDFMISNLQNLVYYMSTLVQGHYIP